MKTWCMKCDKHPMDCSCPQWPAGILVQPSLAAADAVLALINASPRMPTREAIAAVVAENMPAVTINRHLTEEQMKREDAAYLRGCREPKIVRVAWNHESQLLEAELMREQAKKEGEK